jgi:uncharacterized protein (DUF924 family)
MNQEQDPRKRLALTLLQQQLSKSQPTTTGSAFAADALAKGLSGYMLGKQLRKPAAPTTAVSPKYEHSSTVGMTV